MYVGDELICALGIPKSNSFLVSLVFKKLNENGEDDKFYTKLKWIPDTPFSLTFYCKKFQTQKN